MLLRDPAHGSGRPRSSTSRGSRPGACACAPPGPLLGAEWSGRSAELRWVAAGSGSARPRHVEHFGKIAPSIRRPSGRSVPAPAPRAEDVGTPRAARCARERTLLRAPRPSRGRAAGIAGGRANADGNLGAGVPQAPEDDAGPRAGIAGRRAPRRPDQGQEGAVRRGARGAGARPRVRRAREGREGAPGRAGRAPGCRRGRGADPSVRGGDPPATRCRRTAGRGQRARGASRREWPGAWARLERQGRRARR